MDWFLHDNGLRHERVKNNWYRLIEQLVQHIFRADEKPYCFNISMTKYMSFCIRSQFIRNLVLGSLKNKKHSKLQKELHPLTFLEFL